jgi:hypothetical protein
MMERKQKNFKVRSDIAGEFAKVCEILGLDEYEAAEMALQDWVKRHCDEAQKKLDLYAERGITIIEPQTVNIAVFQKAEILLAKEELTRLLTNLECGNVEYHHEMQLELAEALKKIQPVYARTRDPELLSLLRNAEQRMGE